ncbi:hypothetical protein GW932_04230 [archaeon]|nr:hypothetical protein [archaeon]
MKTTSNIYSEVAKCVPRCLDDLEKKYEFEFEVGFRNVGDSHLVQAYPVSNGNEIRVRCDRLEGILDDSDYAFERTKNTYLNFLMGHKIDKEYLGGINLLPKVEGIFLAKEINTGIYYPVISLQDLGGEIIKEMEYGEEKDFAYRSFLKKADLIAPYLFNGEYVLEGKHFDSENLIYGPNIHWGNAIWVPEDVESYLINVESWQFKSRKFNIK